MASTVTLSDYLIRRLQQLDVQTVQGVPGDYNLGLLTKFLQAGTPRWVGNANELNASYSADGLARALGGKKPTVVVTTMGVGELSASNGIAGCMAERLPVIHIVGTPSTTAQTNQLLLHHTLGDGKYDPFLEMARHITAAQVDLGKLHSEGRLNGQSEDAGREIDRVLQTCVRRAMPVYLSIPCDLIHVELSAACSARLQTLIDTSIAVNDETAEKAVLEEIKRRLEAAKCPVIVVDACAVRHDVLAETEELIRASGLPVFTTAMGKTAIDESAMSKQYGGIYLGAVSTVAVKEVMEQKADLVLSIGPLRSDANTGGFTMQTQREQAIDLHSDRTCIGFATYAGVAMETLLPQVTQLFDRQSTAERLASTRKILEKCYSAFGNTLPTAEEELATLSPKIIDRLGGESQVQQTITQSYLWPRVGQFLRPGDHVIGETGTSEFGLMEVRFPAKAKFYAQVLWGSIGWAVGATLGVALEAQQTQRVTRTLLFIGDGSLQLTIQEIGTMLRQGLTPLLFVLNNDGYEIERQIHGAEATYNDVAAYNHSALLDLFSPPAAYRKPSNPSHAADPEVSDKAYHAIHTKAELDALLSDPEFNKADKCHLVEIFVPRGDSPAVLRRQVQMDTSGNTY